MNTELTFLLYLLVVVTPLAIGTVYAIYLFCNSQINLYLLERRIKKQKLKKEKLKTDILLKIDLYLSKTERNEKEVESLSELKQKLESI